MDNKGHKCIFVGYSEETKVYKLYGPDARKFTIRRDVQFVENEAWYGTIEKIVKITDAMEHDHTVYVQSIALFYSAFVNNFI
jgi:hypothetical protein